MIGFGTYVKQARDLSMAKDAGDLLERTYPGHAWMVNVENGFLNIFSIRLSPQWGYRIRLDDLRTDPTMRKVVKAGGEILERYNLARRRYDPGNHIRFAQRPQLRGDEPGAERFRKRLILPPGMESHV